jgi:hypothetical protein
MILHPPSRSRRLVIPALAFPDRLSSALGGRLDDDYHWFRNVTPGASEPVDAVIVGPGGTWTLTLAGERGRFSRRNTGHWYRLHRGTGSWVPWDPVPITAARLAARRLSLYLEGAGLPATVDAVLVPPPDMSVELARGDDIGLVVEPDADRLAALASREARLTSTQVDRIVALLDPRQPLPRLAQATRGG